MSEIVLLVAVDGGANKFTEALTQDKSSTAKKVVAVAGAGAVIIASPAVLPLGFIRTVLAVGTTGSLGSQE